jgi:hypothetical protein
MLTKIIYIRGTNGTVPTPPIQGTATETINGTGSFRLDSELTRLSYNGRGFHRICIESIGTGNTGVFILKAKTRLENTYHLLSDDEDESKITPSDEKLSIPINIITSSSDIEFNCTNITANSVYQLTITTGSI